MKNLRHSLTGSKFALNFSYIGTRFSGVQRQVSREVPNKPECFDNSIQMALDIGLSNLNPMPVNSLRSGLSSRTDSNVHALDNYLFTTLLHPSFPSEDYRGEDITRQMNTFMNQYNYPIRVKKSFSLPDDYRIYRNTDYREYTYRFMLMKDDVSEDFSKPVHVRERLKMKSLQTGLPSFITDRLSFIRSKGAYGSVDLERLKSALRVFVGQHNFSSFESIGVTLTENKRGWWTRRNPVRDLTLFELIPLDPLTILHELEEEGLQVSEESRALLFSSDLHEIRVRSVSFLYRQVRMMIGMSFMVSWGQVPLDRIQFMLDFPHRWHWDKNYFIAPAEGLFLSKVKLKGYD
jgi:tRNA pseudouridine(38-40) synthase